MSSTMMKAFIIVNWANQYIAIEKPDTFNELMWVAYDQLQITQPVIACLTPDALDQGSEMKLDKTLYSTITTGSTVVFRPDGRPSLQEVIDKETQEEEAALEGARMNPSKQVSPAI
jgi:hypothetical protein